MSEDQKRWQIRAAHQLQTWRADLSDPDRASDLAALHRLAVPQDALLLPCFARLCNRTFGHSEIRPYQLDTLARCAFLAGQLSAFEKGASLATAMARRVGGERPVISSVRAVAVFLLEDPDEACMAIASLLRQLGGRVSARLAPRQAVDAMANWERARREIALAYHRATVTERAAPAMPEVSGAGAPEAA